MSIVGYVLTKISVTLYAGGIVFETLMESNFWVGALITVVFTGIYTIFSGLRAVVYTDMMQMIVLIVGAVLVTVLGLAQVGGPAGPDRGDLGRLHERMDADQPPRLPVDRHPVRRADTGGVAPSCSDCSARTTWPPTRRSSSPPTGARRSRDRRPFHL